MRILGLTGPSGAGKGTVGAALSRLGFPVLDTDAVYHTHISGDTPCTRALALAFGSEILCEDGSVDRRRLAAVVFCGGEAEREQKARLNAITHGYVLATCDEWLEEQKAKGVACAVIDAPLLIEARMHERCDLVLAVLAPYELRLARILARDGIPEAAARARLDAQPKEDFYRAHADLVFVNDGDEEGATAFAQTVADAVTQLEK